MVTTLCKTQITPCVQMQCLPYCSLSPSKFIWGWWTQLIRATRAPWWFSEIFYFFMFTIWLVQLWGPGNGVTFKTGLYTQMSCFMFAFVLADMRNPVFIKLFLGYFALFSSGPLRGTGGVIMTVYGMHLIHRAIKTPQNLLFLIIFVKVTLSYSVTLSS